MENERPQGTRNMDQQIVKIIDQVAEIEAKTAQLHLLVNELNKSTLTDQLKAALESSSISIIDMMWSSKFVQPS